MTMPFSSVTNQIVPMWQMMQTENTECQKCDNTKNNLTNVNCLFLLQNVSRKTNKKHVVHLRTNQN